MRIGERPEAKSRSSNGLIHLEHHYLNNIMDMKTMKNSSGFARKNGTTTFMEARKVEYCRSLSSQGNGKKMFSISYFSLESFLLLLCLTASLLLLPLILPPLPPPPFLLLLLPIFIMVVLMFLAFMPSNVRDVTYTYA